MAGVAAPADCGRSVYLDRAAGRRVRLPTRQADLDAFVGGVQFRLGVPDAGRVLRGDRLDRLEALGVAVDGGGHELDCDLLHVTVDARLPEGPLYHALAGLVVWRALRHHSPVGADPADFLADLRVDVSPRHL